MLLATKKFEINAILFFSKAGYSLHPFFLKNLLQFLSDEKTPILNETNEIGHNIEFHEGLFPAAQIITRSCSMFDISGVLYFSLFLGC